MLESAGEGGVTAGEAIGELSKHGFDFKTALNSLESVYKEVGVERHTGKVIRYCKGKPKPEKKEESIAVKMAKKLGQRNIGEKQYNEVIKYYLK